MRIENVKVIKLNRKNVKIFDLYEYDSDQRTYVFAGKHIVPAKTANRELEEYIKNTQRLKELKKEIEELKQALLSCQFDT